MKTAAPVERVDSMAWGRNFPGGNRSGMPIHRAHTCDTEKPPRGTDGGQTAWGRNSHQQEPDSPEQDTFTGHTPAPQKNRRPENRRRLDLRAAQAMR